MWTPCPCKLKLLIFTIHFSVGDIKKQKPNPICCLCIVSQIFHRNPQIPLININYLKVFSQPFKDMNIQLPDLPLT